MDCLKGKKKKKVGVPERIWTTSWFWITVNVLRPLLIASNTQITIGLFLIFHKRVVQSLRHLAKEEKRTATEPIWVRLIMVGSFRYPVLWIADPVRLCVSWWKNADSEVARVELVYPGRASLCSASCEGLWHLRGKTQSLEKARVGGAQSCRLFATPGTTPSMGFSRPECWSGSSFPSSPGDLPNPGIKPGSPALQAGSLPTELWGKKLREILPNSWLQSRAMKSTSAQKSNILKV